MESDLINRKLSSWPCYLFYPYLIVKIGVKGLVQVNVDCQLEIIHLCSFDFEFKLDTSPFFEKLEKYAAYHMLERACL